MTTTSIPWVINPDGTPGEVWNPVRGCSPVSAGCANCYAARFATRFSGPGQPYEGLAKHGHWTGKVRVIEDLEAPYRWRKPRMIFVNSMSDLLHPQISDGDFNHVRWVMSHNRIHTFVVLTKRPERLRLLSPDTFRAPNIWLGVSVEDQATADERIPLLLDACPTHALVSIEPQLGPVVLRDEWLNFDALQWVICGCESGPGRRPFDYAWARSLRDQCVPRGTPFFLKQIPDISGAPGAGVVELPILDGVMWRRIPRRGEP